MKEGSKTVRFILWIGLLGCLLILTKFILFKKSPSYYKHYFTNEYQHYSWKKGWKNGNKTPFKSIRLLTGRYVTSEYSYRNIGGNIVGFIPLGLILPALLTGFRSIFRTTGAVFLLSACFELMQLGLGIGAFDVDDLILNTCGGLIGYLLFVVFRLIFPPRETAQS